jgi:hypothetical protein
LVDSISDQLSLVSRGTSNQGKEGENSSFHRVSLRVISV